MSVGAGAGAGGVLPLEHLGAGTAAYGTTSSPPVKGATAALSHRGKTECGRLARSGRGGHAGAVNGCRGGRSPVGPERVTVVGRNGAGPGRLRDGRRDVAHRAVGQADLDAGGAHRLHPAGVAAEVPG